MEQHNWINLPGNTYDEISYWWCPDCGTVRIEYHGEAEPYEYFAQGSTPKKQNGWFVGETCDPGCQKKSTASG